MMGPSNFRHRVANGRFGSAIAWRFFFRQPAPHTMRFLVVLMAIVFSLTANSPGQTSLTHAVDSPPVLDLAQCQASALRLNRGLQTARNQLTAAVAGERMAESDVFAPRLELTQNVTEDNELGEGRAELNYLTPLGFEVTPFFTENQNSQSQEEEWSSAIGITLSRRLFSTAERWRLRLPLASAERALLKTENDLRLRVRELNFSVMQAFLAVQRVQNRLRVRRNRVLDAREFLGITSNRVDKGLVPRIDIENSKINLNQAEADVLNDEATLRDRTESLLNIIGLPVTNRLQIVPYDVNRKSGREPDLHQDSTDLLARHESLLNNRLDIDFARVEIRIQRDLLRPQLGLSFTAEHKSDGADPFAERDDDEEGVRVQLTYNLALDGKKRDRARLRQLELGLDNLESGLVDEEYRLLQELRSAHRSIERLKLQVGLNQQRLEAERARLKATIVRYEDGNVDNLEVTRAKQAVDDAEISLNDTHIDLALARERYKSLVPPARRVQTRLTAP